MECSVVVVCGGVFGRRSTAAEWALQASAPAGELTSAAVFAATAVTRGGGGSGGGGGRRGRGGRRGQRAVEET